MERGLRPLWAGFLGIAAMDVFLRSAAWMGALRYDTWEHLAHRVMGPSWGDPIVQAAIGFMLHACFGIAWAYALDGLFGRDDVPETSPFEASQSVRNVMLILMNTVVISALWSAYGARIGVVYGDDLWWVVFGHLLYSVIVMPRLFQRVQDSTNRKETGADPRTSNA